VLPDEVRKGPLRLGLDAARLVVEDVAFAPALMAAAPHLRRARHRVLVAGSVATIILLTTVAALWWRMPVLAAAIAKHVPVAWERQLGEDVEAQPWLGKRCSDPEGEAALGKLMQRLIQGIDTPYPIVVSVRDSAMVNAIALPGGHVVLLRGLLSEAQSPDEVAGVLAHELTHVRLRHPMRALIANSGLALLFELTIGNGTGASVGLLLTTLSYSRAMEAEADDGGLALLRRADISSDGLAAFFGRLNKREHGLPVPYLSSHPPTAERLAIARAQPAGHTRPALSETEWHALKAICQGKR
jgi:beta-barrel assembly-enhancing protease